MARSVDLLLDAYNPRLRREEEGGSQEALREALLKRFNLAELAESIVATGYSDFDPIVGIAEGPNEAITVLEGNRRVATIQLLLDPSLAPAAHQLRWRSLSSQLRAEVRSQIEELHVRTFTSRAAVDVASYIGFRHVTGVLPWPALEKAKYIAYLVDRLGWSYETVAERLGSKPANVERHHVAHQLVRQAQDEGIDGAERMEGQFGVLMRAMTAGGVSDFLGVRFAHDPHNAARPVPADKDDELRDFVRWTFGTDGTEGEEGKRPLLRDSRDLTRWGRILRSPQAIAYLRRTAEPSFERAWQRAGGEEEALIDVLQGAADRLQESVPLVALYRENTEIYEAVRRCEVFLRQIIESLAANPLNAANEPGPGTVAPGQ